MVICHCGQGVRGDCASCLDREFRAVADILGWPMMTDRVVDGALPMIVLGGAGPRLAAAAVLRQYEIEAMR